MISIDNFNNIIDINITNIKNLLGNSGEILVRKISIGKITSIDAAIIYINGLVNKDMINRDILNPLMFHIEEDIVNITNIEDYICKRYIPMNDLFIESDINKACENIKRGYSVILINNSPNFIIVDTSDKIRRSISEPPNESSVKGPRDGFIENLDTNISLMKQRIKDRNLVTEKLVLGRKSQTDAVLMYMNDIVDKKLLEEIRKRIKDIDIDNVQATSSIEQCIEKHPFSIFPQSISSERPDRIQANLMEGRIALFLQNTPYVLTFPTLFVEFFHTVEDYYNRTILSSCVRVIRYIAAVIVIALPAVYITLTKFNAELIPVEYISALIESRKGISLTDFMSILFMNLIVEFLREGGLRLPNKIGQTLSVVGGIIIGDAALKARLVSSTTLLVIGVTTIATFLIPNYEMSLSIRLLSYPTLILANWLGMLGIDISFIFILAHLCSLDSFGVPYFSFKRNDFKDTLVRYPIWMMDNTPTNIPNNNPIRQKKFRRKKNG